MSNRVVAISLRVDFTESEKPYELFIHGFGARANHTQGVLEAAIAGANLVSLMASFSTNILKSIAITHCLIKAAGGEP